MLTKEESLPKITFRSPAEKVECEADTACRKLVQDYSSSIFQILTDKNTAGTGWLTPDGRVFTDHHVIASASQVVAIDSKGRRHHLGANSTIDEATDTAVLGFASSAPFDGKRLMVAEKPPAPGEKLYSLNHSDSLPLQLQLGRQRLTQTGEQAFIEKTGENTLLSYYEALKKKNASEYASLKLQLSRVFDHIELGAKPGASGAPVLKKNPETQDLEVSSVVDRASPYPTMDLTTTAADIKSVLNKPSTHYGQYISGLGHLMQTARIADIAPTTSWLGMGGLASLRAAQAGAKVAPAVAAIVIGEQGLKDFSRFTASSETRDLVKYGYSLVGDSTMAAGLATRIMARSGAVGLGVLAAGAVLRLSAELVPNEYILKKKDQ